jgi:hypothetical protein
MTIASATTEFDLVVAEATADQIVELRRQLYKYIDGGLSDAEIERCDGLLNNRELELRRASKEARKVATPKVAQPTPERRPAPAPVPSAPTSFTGRKLDLLRAVRFDWTVSDYAYRVMSVIVDHLNERTERTKISDETIGFETSSYSRKVRRARQDLHSSKWLTWTRTRDANIYSVNWGTAKPFLAQLEKYRAAKREKFNKIADNLSQIGHQCPISGKRLGNKAR